MNHTASRNRATSVTSRRDPGDAALARIEAGEYGECVQCGKKIAEKRLELLPDTRLCANCAT
ncbi:TraR/DksA family transcriptional regulator [Paracoccus contaminans]|uniref:TraR/DksA family transcriptional regulator n=1 Tax=Paracoccus contaminans TaxID=1945662 RepID=UPI00308450F6